MPKWIRHREVAKLLGIKLSEDAMRYIDEVLDGLIEGFEHDFWRQDKQKFLKELERFNAQFGVESVYYALLHIFIDEVELQIAAELGGKRADRIGYDSAIKNGSLKAMDYLVSFKQHAPPKLYKDIEDFIERLQQRLTQIAQYVVSLPEVDTKVRTMKNFGDKVSRFREPAIRYMHAFKLSPTSIPIIINILTKLSSKHTCADEEWASRVYMEFKEKYARGATKEMRERLYACFNKIVNDWLEKKI